MPIKIFQRHSDYPIDNHSYIEVNVDYQSEDNDDEASTCSGDSIYDVFCNDQKKITLQSKLWVKTNKSIFQCIVMRILYSDMECDANYLEVNGLTIKQKIDYW